MVSLLASTETQLYVVLPSVMHPMVAAYDGIDTTVFEDDGIPYIKIDDAIRWLQRECDGNPVFASQPYGGKGKLPTGLERLKVLQKARVEWVKDKTATVLLAGEQT